MRHLHGEQVEVHEAEGPDLAALLREAADLIDSTEHGYVNVHTYFDTEGDGYLVNVYLF